MSSAKSEYRQIAAALQRVIKGRKITYEELGKRLGISSRTVKRIIKGDDYSISKLAEVCDCIGIRFFDLMQLAHEEKEESFQLTKEQEEFFASSPQHYKFLTELIRKKKLQEIRDQNNITRKDTDRYLRDLEKMGILERLPGEDYKLKVRGGHNFISNGPLDKAISRRDALRFLEMIQDEKGTKCFSTSSGIWMSLESIKKLTGEMSELAAKYRIVAQREYSLLPEKELVRMRWMFSAVWPFESWIAELKL